MSLPLCRYIEAGGGRWPLAGSVALGPWVSVVVID